MPYQIYTYEDPYKLDQTDFWEQISALPHFCNSRTLVNGLKLVLTDRIQGLICPFDDFVNHKDVYGGWTNNIGLRIRQYSVLSAAFHHMLDQNQIDEQFFLALCQNQNHFLEALRLMIEMNISASSFRSDVGNPEQKLLISLLEKAQSNRFFSFPATPNRSELKDVLVRIAENEVRECRGTEREKNRCERAVSKTSQSQLRAIVVHGVHQFTPTQLRLLIAMEQMGITIIFLFNYQKRYSQMYDSWCEIYGCFDVPIHHDTAVSEYQTSTMQNASNALACALAELCKDRTTGTREAIKRLYQHYRSIEFREFENITEYAHFVSEYFDAAYQKYKSSQGIIERGNQVWNEAAVLKRMEEQVYTANRDVHTLLKIYYPEYTKDRHFLSYPIGQFFTALYRMWDHEAGEIKIDVASVKECLSSNLLHSAPGEQLLKTFHNVEILFENIQSYSQFKREIAEEYYQRFQSVSKEKKEHFAFPLKQLSIYNRELITYQEIKDLIKAIEEVNTIAEYLFDPKKNHGNTIDFGTHFHNLEEFLKQRELTLVNVQERALIQALQSRLNQIRPDHTSFSGTIRDLKEGLHYYLKQKDDDKNSVDWIVKNFEQIDGDILQSEGQFSHDEKKTYHFACLSDYDMNKTVDDLLPWPLTESYIQEACTTVDLIFQVYVTALSERSSFLRYALFYGLFYNQCGVRLSYVKQYGDTTTEPYSLLGLLGLQPKAGLIESIVPPVGYSLQIDQVRTNQVPYACGQMIDMFLCPYRYFLDYVVCKGPVYHGYFLYQKYYENLLIEAAWKKIQKLNCVEAKIRLRGIVLQESQRLEPYFPFWKATEFIDLKRRAENYVLHRIIGTRGSVVQPYNESHMQIRRQFGKAQFSIDVSRTGRRNPYVSFESLAKYVGQKKMYSLHKIPKTDSGWNRTPQTDSMKQETKDYLNQSFAQEKAQIAAEWCQFCAHRGNCLSPFLEDE